MEILNPILELAIGSHTIHIHGSGKCKSQIDHVHNTLCRETDVHIAIFQQANAVADPAAYWDRKSRNPHGECKDSADENEKFTIPLLLTCRQLYFDSHSFYYANQTFLFDNYGTLSCFYRRLHCNTHYLVHNVILHMDVSYYKYNVAWETVIGKDLINMRRGFGMENLQVFLLQDHHDVFPAYTAPKKDSFMRELCKLGSTNAKGQKVLPNLKTCQVMITDHAWMGYHSPSVTFNASFRPNGVPGVTLWTYEQKLEWVKFIRDCIMGVVPDKDDDGDTVMGD
ncbi:MAG: hypothetical protein Q9218_002175 [Villophora microphyllina]